MALEHQPLQPDELPPEVAEALASERVRAMTARGLAPIARPAHLVTALYQLAVGDDAGLRSDADRSLSELPDGIVAAALGDPELHPRVLDHAAVRHRDRADLLETIVTNPGVADETVAEIATRAGESLCDRIAENQQRLLRHPPVIAALYRNRRARMSTVDRIVELAVRSGVKVLGIPAWEEIANAALSSATAGGMSAAEADAVFASAAAEAEERARGELVEVNDDEPRPESRVKISEMSVPMKIRLATLGSRFFRSQLVRDPSRPVAMAAIKSPHITEMEALRYASSMSLHEDVIKHIAARRDWTRLPAMKLALVQNPKTPLPASMRFLPYLREKDIRAIARSKGVPSALSAQAKKMIMQRQRGGKR